LMGVTTEGSPVAGPAPAFPKRSAIRASRSSRRPTQRAAVQRTSRARV
jgi:hypothetical protein